MDVIETLQARISTLEVELSRIVGMAEQGAAMAKTDWDKRGLLLILRTAQAALEPAAPSELTTEAPAVEAVIKVGDDVKIIADGRFYGETGKVKFFDGERYTIIGRGTYVYQRHQIEPA